MAKIPFIWLGSKRSRKHPLSPKAALLDVASSRGLPVPNGGVLLHDLYRLLLAEEVLQQNDSQVTAPDPLWLYDTIYESVRFPRLETAVAVRAAFAGPPGPDGDPQPFPVGPPVPDVDSNDPQQLAHSLCEVWSRGEGVARRDLLVMEMVARQQQGTAVFQPDRPVDHVTIPQTTTVLPRLGRWQRPDSELPPYLRRLQQLLRGTRRAFGTGCGWQITWTDDGEICWLLQIEME